MTNHPPSPVNKNVQIKAQGMNKSRDCIISQIKRLGTGGPQHPRVGQVEQNTATDRLKRDPNSCLHDIRRP